MDSESLDRCIQTALSALYPPFQATSPTILCQVLNVVESCYRGDGLRYLIHFLLPVKQFLANLQQDACLQYCGLLFLHEGWPLCVHEKVVVQLCPLDQRLLRPGDFYLLVSPPAAAAAAPPPRARSTSCRKAVPSLPRLLLCSVSAGSRHVEQQEVSEIALRSLFSMAWLDSVNREREQRGAPRLERCLLSAHGDVFRVPWEDLVYPQFISRPRTSLEEDKESSVKNGNMLINTSHNSNASGRGVKLLPSSAKTDQSPASSEGEESEGEYVELTELPLPRFSPQKGSLTQSISLQHRARTSTPSAPVMTHTHKTTNTHSSWPCAEVSSHAGLCSMLIDENLNQDSCGHVILAPVSSSSVPPEVVGTSHRQTESWMSQEQIEGTDSGRSLKINTEPANCTEHREEEEEEEERGKQGETGEEREEGELMERQEGKDEMLVLADEGEEKEEQVEDTECRKDELLYTQTAEEEEEDESEHTEGELDEEGDDELEEVEVEEEVRVIIVQQSQERREEKQVTKEQEREGGEEKEEEEGGCEQTHTDEKVNSCTNTHTEDSYSETNTQHTHCEEPNQQHKHSEDSYSENNALQTHSEDSYSENNALQTHSEESNTPAMDQDSLWTEPEGSKNGQEKKETKEEEEEEEEECSYEEVGGGRTAELQTEGLSSELLPVQSHVSLSTGPSPTEPELPAASPEQNQSAAPTVPVQLTQSSQSSFYSVLLSSGAVCMPGTSDRSGRALLTVCTGNAVWSNPDCDSAALLHLLLYYTSTLRKEARASGLTVLVDARSATPVPTLFSALRSLQYPDVQSVSEMFSRQTFSLQMFTVISDVQCFTVSLQMFSQSQDVHISIQTFQSVSKCSGHSPAFSQSPDVYKSVSSRSSGLQMSPVGRPDASVRSPRCSQFSIQTFSLISKCSVSRRLRLQMFYSLRDVYSLQDVQSVSRCSVESPEWFTVISMFPQSVSQMFTVSSDGSVSIQMFHSAVPDVHSQYPVRSVSLQMFSQPPNYIHSPDVYSSLRRSSPDVSPDVYSQSPDVHSQSPDVLCLM
ncbi:uncharacterized protein LOC118320831 [Morone saxatilis]|uniref:uncharacterized protein LOC118320831 n=1 Tax=Morone saxatilis TaxID=34816 RepID=UPI0015E1E576|nr:uncharacterized protein LOC118320831 [Morone saxatilis]